MRRASTCRAAVCNSITIFNLVAQILWATNILRSSPISRSVEARPIVGGRRRKLQRTVSQIGSFASTSDDAYVVDASYHYEGAKAVLKILRDSKRDMLKMASHDGGPKVIKVDVSSSLLGDDGMSDVLALLLSTFSPDNHGHILGSSLTISKSRRTLGIQLEARMNRLTKHGAGEIFDTLLENNTGYAFPLPNEESTGESKHNRTISAKTIRKSRTEGSQPNATGATLANGLCEAAGNQLLQQDPLESNTNSAGLARDHMYVANTDQTDSSYGEGSLSNASVDISFVNPDVTLASDNMTQNADDSIGDADSPLEHSNLSISSEITTDSGASMVNKSIAKDADVMFNVSHTTTGFVAANNTTSCIGESDAKAAPDANAENCFYVESLDIGFNYIGSGSGYAKSLRKLIESPCGSCPHQLRLDQCGLGPTACRAIGKGIINRASFTSNMTNDLGNHRRGLLELHLSGNKDIGDAGTAALAAALRTAARRRPFLPASLSYSQGDFVEDRDEKTPPLPPLLDVLDLSSCNVGDAGAEALAMALEGSPGCVRHLDLSNNKISDEGLASIGRALVAASSASSSMTTESEDEKMAKRRRRSTQPPLCWSNRMVVADSIDVSNNKGITDKGATALASAIQCGSLRSAFVRSCSVRADGAMAFGRAVAAFATLRGTLSNNGIERERENVENGEGYYEKERKYDVLIDLSGNKLGIHKSKEVASKFSASDLTNKASATTAQYMNLIGSRIKSGLKDAGLDIDSFIPTADSDDDVEALAEDFLESEADARNVASLSSAPRCGARSFADPIVNVTAATRLQRSGQPQQLTQAYETKGVLCMRNCLLDSGAADALAAAIVTAGEKWGMKLICDASMNPAVEEDMLDALRGEENAETLLLERAKNYADAMEALRIAKERAAAAAEAAAARVKAEAAFGAAWEQNDDYGLSYDGYDVGYDDYQYDEIDEYESDMYS